MKINIKNAPSISNSNNHIPLSLRFVSRATSHQLLSTLFLILLLTIVGGLGGCATSDETSPHTEERHTHMHTAQTPATTPTGAAVYEQAETTQQTTTQPYEQHTHAQPHTYTQTQPTIDASQSILDLRQPVPPFSPRTIRRGKSTWTAAPWDSLPGLYQDDLQGALTALLQSCNAGRTALPHLCAEAGTMQYASAEQQRKWLQIRLQPYRLQNHSGNSRGLLTSYYEPVLQASRLPNAQFNTPLYSPPAGLSKRRWYSRKQIETNPRAIQALQGRELVYLAGPIDALILHIQGSGKVNIVEPDGTITQRRMAFAGTNNHRYGSVAKRLLRTGQIQGASWPDIKAWAQRSNPQAVQQALWRNPRYVFFREEMLDGASAYLGPKGAQGVPLTGGRSIAVDPKSIPYGTPVWLASTGAATNLQRLVIAQDTGNAIRGAVRADYFAGSGDAAGEFAGRIKQPLALWALWPR